jgi:hypothetical protein
VLLLSGSDGTPLDVALGAIPFEHRSVERGSHWHLPAGRSLLTCSAEDLIVHKAFASRDHDWVDIDGVVVRQGSALDTALIVEELRPLVALKEEPGNCDASRSNVARTRGAEQRLIDWGLST